MFDEQQSNNVIVISKSGRQAFRNDEKEVKETTIFLEVQKLYHSKVRNIYKRYYESKQYAEELKKNEGRNK